MSTITDQIKSITNQTTKANANNAPSQELDSDAFLRLLMVQLQNQDPTSPMDTNAMMEQQATLTQVQETQELNDSLAEMTSEIKSMANYMATSNQVSQASSLIGKEVTVVNPEDPDNEITGTVQEANFYSDGTTIKLEDGEEYLINYVKSLK